jgi:hypothetical protein
MIFPETLSQAIGNLSCLDRMMDPGAARGVEPSRPAPFILGEEAESNRTSPFSFGGGEEGEEVVQLRRQSAV